MRRYLTPRMVGAHLLALLAVAVAGGFGVWQFAAWQDARAEEQRDLTGAEPVLLADLLGPDQPLTTDQVGRPVRVAGEWLPESSVLVGGRTEGDIDGYWVVTALTDERASEAGEPVAIPVVRGWIPDVDAAPDPPRGAADLTMWLQPPEGTGAIDEDPTDDVLVQLRVADLIQRVDVDLYSAFGVAVTPTEPALEPATLEQLPPVGRFTALRNLLYALEWWVFAGFAAFIWWRFVRDETEPDRPVASTA